MNDKLQSMSIEITKRCNFRCKFCYASSNMERANEAKISEEKLDELIYQIKINNLEKVTLTGGEPLMEHALFLRIIKKLRENNIVINLNTNISLLTDKIAGEILKYIGKEYFIFTSLLSPSEETCDEITGIQGSYKKIIAGIECGKRHGLKLSVNFTISKDNIDDLMLIPQFVEDHTLDRVSISRVIPPSYDRTSEKNILNQYEIKSIANMLVEINKKYNIPVTSSHPLPLCVIGNKQKYKIIESQRCWTGVKYCAVNLHSGNVFACSQEEKNYGNIYQDGLYDCWLKMKDEHGLLILDKKCVKCELLDECGGECKWSACTIC